MKQSELIAEAERCVACGLCLPYCPTYRLIQSEADSPRGRIQMVSAVAQGKLLASPRFAEHIDRCLSCRACERSCPNSVRYGLIADGARGLIAQTIKRHWVQRLLQHVAHYVLSSRALTRFAGKILRIMQCTGLYRLARVSLRLEKLVGMLPVVPSQQRWRECYPAEKMRGEVCLFLGCISDMLDTNTLRATVFVLNKLGYTVHIPPSQTCCGALSRSAGDTAQAEALAVRNKNAFTAYSTLPLLSVASGCGASLHDYLGRPIQDVSAFLAKADGWEGVSISRLDGHILVQDPCTLRNVLDQSQSVYDMLRRIPGAEVLPLAGNGQCCGGAGAYMLTQPDLARQLRDAKIAACRTTESAWLATSNIGCALHIAAGLREAGMTITVAHPVLILARQMGFTGHI